MRWVSERCENRKYKFPDRETGNCDEALRYIFPGLFKENKVREKGEPSEGAGRASSFRPLMELVLYILSVTEMFKEGDNVLNPEGNIWAKAETNIII